MVIESQLKITNIPWNDSLNDPNSEIFQDLKLNLEMELDKTFCNNSENINDNNGNITCYTEVIGFRFFQYPEFLIYILIWTGMAVL